MHLCDSKTAPALAALLGRYRLRLEQLADGASIPGSYWGAPEAGVVGSRVYVRPDTPLHSALHEAAHVVCMDAARRAQLHTDAGGDYDEENGVCYLQILLAAALGVEVAALCADMDAWGYTFRLGSAYAWFSCDAHDARAWLEQQGVITAGGSPTWRRRGDDVAAARHPGGSAAAERADAPGRALASDRRA